MHTSLVRSWVLVAALVLSAGAAGGTAAAQSTSVAVDCSAAIHFEIANPTPGSRVEPGSYVVQGVALDARADDGSPGIDGVDFFLGDRDAGGTFLGHAVPASTGPLAQNSFETVITLPRTTTGAADLFGYARSSVTGEEGIVSVPIAIGVDPNKAGDTLTRSPITDCAAPPTNTLAAGTTATQPQAAQPEPPLNTAGDMPTPDNSHMYLEVGNPSAGDTIHAGTLTIDGIAFDRAADSGPGIDRIDIFLDDRNQGGTIIGHATLGASSIQPDDPDLSGAGWTARIEIPAKMTGVHTLFVYALSSATGGELTVGIPVQVAQ